jgi:putative tryptophan/tyrosine transport system substrate-binding protein
MELHGRRQLLRRRDFIALLGGTAATWPPVARAQQSDRMRLIGMLMNLPKCDPVGATRVAAFLQGLQESPGGWRVGVNLQIETRWGAGDEALYRRYATELVALTPDVILAAGGTVAALREATRTVPVPIVFTVTIDPVALGYVESLARPGGNATGFTNINYGFSAKYLDLLHDIAPGVTRAAVLRAGPGFLGATSGAAQFNAIQAQARKLGIELSPVDVNDAGEIERGITAFATKPNGGLIVTASIWATAYHDLIVKLAAQYRLPAVYPNRAHVIGGGLISYGPSISDQYRQAGGYVARILNGDKPADLPVQAPTIYETWLNLGTANALGLVVPKTVNARVDNVINGSSAPNRSGGGKTAQCN